MRSGKPEKELNCKQQQSTDTDERKNEPICGGGPASSSWKTSPKDTADTSNGNKAGSTAKDKHSPDYFAHYEGETTETRQWINSINSFPREARLNNSGA
jgi:hypothetical protein